jgi:hypothetical protein
VTANTIPILYLDIDGVLLRRRHAGMFDAFEIAPDCVEFLEWQRLDFNAVGFRPVFGLVGLTAHAEPSTMPVLGWMILDGRCSV